MAIDLPHTLQSWMGMVQGGGCPQPRRIPARVANIGCSKHHSSSIYKGQRRPTMTELINLAVEYLKSYSTTIPTPGSDDSLLRYAANLAACKELIHASTLKNYMHQRTRLDLEQAAAVVISAFRTAGRTDDAVRLLREATGVFTTSCMWQHPDDPVLPSQAPSAGLLNLATKLRVSASKKGIDVPLATSLEELVPILMRVRRCKPDNRCLMIPKWMFDDANIPAAPHFQLVFETDARAKHPTASCEENSILVSRRHFRMFQRKIFHLFQFWKPTVSLRRDIRRLADEAVQYFVAR